MSKEIDLRTRKIYINGAGAQGEITTKPVEIPEEAVEKALVETEDEAVEEESVSEEQSVEQQSSDTTSLWATNSSEKYFEDFIMALNDTNNEELNQTVQGQSAEVKQILPILQVRVAEFPKLNGETIPLFIYNADLAYELFNIEEDEFLEKFYISLLMLKVSNEIFEQIRIEGTPKNYNDFKKALKSILQDDVGIDEARQNLSCLRKRGNETTLEFGNRVQQSLNVLTRAYTNEFDSDMMKVPDSIIKSITDTAIEVFCQCIPDSDTRILLIAEKHPDLKTVIVLADNKINRLMNSQNFVAEEEDRLRHYGSRYLNY